MCNHFPQYKMIHRCKLLLKFVMESTSGFAYVYNTNTIEIVTKGRIWPRAFDYSNFFFFLKGRRKKKKIKDFLFKAENFQTRVSTCQGHGSQADLLEGSSEDEGKLQEQELKEKNLLRLSSSSSTLAENSLSNQLDTHILTVKQ